MPLFIFLLGCFGYIYVEISLLVSVGSRIGVLPLMLLMIAISALGLWLIKIRGIVTLWQIRQQLSEGKIPAQAVISSLFFAMAGVLLIIPGFLSDILAILVLLPITRKLFQALFLKYFTTKFRVWGRTQRFRSSSQHTETFEAEFERKPDENKFIR